MSLACDTCVCARAHEMHKLITCGYVKSENVIVAFVQSRQVMTSYFKTVHATSLTDENKRLR